VAAASDTLPDRSSTSGLATHEINGELEGSVPFLFHRRVLEVQIQLSPPTSLAVAAISGEQRELALDAPDLALEQRIMFVDQPLEAFPLWVS
jgi:hypothetical protein